MELTALPVPISPERAAPTPWRPRAQPVEQPRYTGSAGQAQGEAPFAEEILQGELLRAPHEESRPEGSRARVFDQARREDHPAFYRRHDNDSYVSRRALAAYETHLDVEHGGRSANGGVDYFI